MRVPEVTQFDRFGESAYQRHSIYHLLTLRFPFKKFRVKKADTSGWRASMINQLVERKQSTSSWVLSPGFLIDRFLDNIEKLSSFVLPLKIVDPSYREAEIEARLERFGA
jgi:hypothetical protein